MDATVSRLRRIELSPDDAEARQVAALCWRLRKGTVVVLLVTSRDTGRWVLPKGWPMAGRAPHEAALREAWEEAGVRGTAGAEPIGSYGYLKQIATGRDIRCRVTVYPVSVAGLSKDFPERRARRRRWMTPGNAAAAVQEPGLQAILRAFDPRPCAGDAPASA